MARRYGHRIDNVAFGDDAQAHIGDTVTIKHYHVNTPLPANVYETLLASMTFDGMDARARNVATALPTTCEWLLSHQHFVAWTDDTKIHEHNGLLWIKGKPGSGKSTITKETFVWAEKTWSDQIVLSYFFDARSPHLLEKSSLGLYRALLHQLLCRLLNIRSLFSASFVAKVRNGKVEEWNQTEMENFFIQLVRTLRGPPITVFIDALDEGADDDIRQMVMFLESLVQHAVMAACPLRICLSSRHYPHISVEKSLSLILEDQVEHDQDIELYVRRKLLGGGSSGMDDLRNRVRDQSEGIFLWVVLVVPILNKAYDRGKIVATMLRKLNEIPSDLCELFTQIFLKDTEDLNECVTLLQWVLYAKRPFTPVELYYAVQQADLQIDDGESEIVTVDEATRYVRNCSRGLIELTKANEPIVQFIHETVRDYLTDEGTIERLSSLGVHAKDFWAETCHTKLAEICLNYLLQSYHKLSEFGDIPDHAQIMQVLYHNRFALYAAGRWWQHLQSAPSPCNARAVQLASKLLTMSPRSLLFWTRLYEVSALEPQSISQFEVDALAGPLHCAVSLGIHELVSGLLDLGVDVEAQVQHMTALMLASRLGYESVVRMLVNAGADVNTQQYSGKTALHMASELGHEKVVQILIEAGADVNAQDDFGKTALHTASPGVGNERVVQMLLDAKADTEIEETEWGIPLQTASFYNHINIVQMLLDAGADINAEEGRNGPALQVAIRYSREKTTQKLVDCGAVVPIRAGCYEKGLLTASIIGHEKIVRVLVNAGADINAPDVGEGQRDGFNRTALEAASTFGHAKIVKILLDAGADVNAPRVPFFSTALQAASMEGHEDIVRMLVDAGADVNAPGGAYGTALQGAARSGSEEAVRILIEAGADIEARAGERNINALHEASIKGHEKIVQILIDAGADVNSRVEYCSQGTWYYSALQAALAGGHTGVAQLLIQHGAKSEEVDGKSSVEDTPVDMLTSQLELGQLI